MCCGGDEFIQICNKQFGQIINPSNYSELIGSTAKVAFSENWDSIYPKLKDAMNGKPSISVALIFKTDEESLLKNRYFDFSYTPIKSFKGEVQGILITAIETTHKHATELQLRESQNQLQFAIDSAELGTFDYNPNTNLFFGNERFNHWFGIPNFSVHQPIDLSISLFSIVDNDRERVAKAISDSFIYELGGKYDIEYTVVNQQTNKKTTLRVMGRAWFDQNNQPFRFNGTLQDITERKKAEELTLASERKLRSIIDQAPIAIAIFRGENHIIEIANSHAFDIWQKKSINMINQPLLEAMPELLPYDIKKILDSVYKTGNRFTATEHPLDVLKNDTLNTIYLNLTFDPLYDSVGQINGIIAISFEVTQHVATRKKIEVNEERLNVVIDASELGTWEYQVSPDIVFCSERCLELLGCKGLTNYSHDDLIKHIHPEDLKDRNQGLALAFEKGMLQYTVRIVNQDKSIHWIESKGKVFYDEKNKPFKIIGTVRDITEEKNTQQRLEEREEKFRLLADSMPQQIWTADVEGNLNYFNNSVFHYSGMNHQEVLEQGWLSIVHPDDRQENIEKWIQAIKSGNDFLLEHRFRRYDGNYRWKLSRAIPQKDEFGNIQRWVGTSTDIQDQKVFTNKLEKLVIERTQEINQKNEDLEKMNEELQSFAYISSHDLQEPLRKIQTLATRIADKEKENLSDYGKDYFERIQKSANRMQALIEDLLAYSRTSTQNKKTELLQLSDIVDEIKENFKEEIEEKNALITVHKSLEIKVIHFQFCQLLTNLVSNSLKFSRPNTTPIINLVCQLYKDEEGTYYNIKYSDNGIGFDDEYKEKIFGLFQRLHGKHTYPGTGIGLAIVRKIMDNHKGYIYASGEKGVGATFDMYLPIN